MNTLSIDIKNCYGIKLLTATIDFLEGNTHIIYAPNGSMKSSFAKVFKDIKEDRRPKDRIFTHRPSSFDIKYNNVPLDSQQVVIVDPYVENFNNERINTLLATDDLKEKYNEINSDIKSKLNEFMSSMSARLKIKGDPAKEMYATFPESEGDLVKCIFLLKNYLEESNEIDFSWIDYAVLFNDKSIAFLQSVETKNLLEEYSAVFNGLIENSHYFRKGGFNHNSAGDISKGLSSSGFFDAKHSVILSDIENNRVEIADQKAFDEIVTNEKNILLENPDLRSRFEKIDKAITKNAELRQLRQYLEANQSLSTELIDLDAFRKKVWLSYAIIEKDKLVSFTEAYTSGKGELEKIVHEAKEQRTNWESVVQLFNERFTVPFKIIISNKEDVILKDEAASVAFKYTDNGEEKIIGKDDLIAVLSVGERRAYHLLNVIYEIENRKNKSEKTILIIDDIADSFDYKNKYAIIQYLKDVSSYTDFYQIILTHNFDFFKTVQSRLHIGRDKNCHMVIKETCQIKLVKAEYMDPFKYFRNNINKDHKIAIAAIPFFRNIAEYTQGARSEAYLKLTSLLHIKNDTETITVSDYGTLVNQLINTSFVLNDGNKKVIELIFEVANSCNNGIESINLEKKIVLSIAIRLMAEKFIITHLGVGCLDGIETNQTVELSFKYSNAFPDNVEVIKILERVILMTPENIHLNSFMYEPLLDMSDHHLCDLFDKVRSLSFPNCNPV